jgi:hypothetical protein
MAIETTFTLTRHKQGDDLIVQISKQPVTKDADRTTRVTTVAPRAKIFGAVNGEADWWIHLDFDEVEAIYQAMTKSQK